MKLRPARRTELAELSALCLRSKAHWGYDAEFMAACRAELTLSAKDLDASLLQVAEQGGLAIGVAQLGLQGNKAELDKLFVEPGHIGSGIGRALFAWAAQAARDAGAGEMVIESDPAAAPFYRRMGARDAGTAPSGAIAGRELPRLIVTL